MEVKNLCNSQCCMQPACIQRLSDILFVTKFIFDYLIVTVMLYCSAHLTHNVPVRFAIGSNLVTSDLTF